MRFQGSFEGAGCFDFGVNRRILNKTKVLFRILRTKIAIFTPNWTIGAPVRNSPKSAISAGKGGYRADSHRRADTGKFRWTIDTHGYKQYKK